jgi:hypothetical protein
MTTYGPSARLLLALFDMLQSQEPVELFSLSETAGLNLYRTLAELQKLGERGFVDPRRLQLTLSGLAVAAALDRRSKLTGIKVASARRGQTPHGGRVYSLSPRPNREQLERTKQELLGRDLVA